MNIQNQDMSSIISKIFSDELKTKTVKEIIKEFPKIKNKILKFLDLLATHQNLGDTEKQIFIEDLFNKIKINGLSIKIYQEDWEKENQILIYYKQLYDVANKLDIFPKKAIKIIINNQESDIEVIDTGKKYIPSSNIDLTSEIIEELDKLKTQENIILNEIKQTFLDQKKEIENDFNSSINILTSANQDETSFRI